MSTQSRLRPTAPPPVCRICLSRSLRTILHTSLAHTALALPTRTATALFRSANRPLPTGRAPRTTTVLYPTRMVGVLGEVLVHITLIAGVLQDRMYKIHFLSYLGAALNLGPLGPRITRTAAEIP